MAKNIDPAFQAAPFLGESSHDPIEFTRRQKMLRYQAQQKREKEQELNTAKGLEKLMLDIKGWEDQKGFKEVMDSYNKNIDAFMELSKKGLNLTSPKTESEIMAFKRLNDEHEKTKQLLDTWNRNKMAYDLANATMKQDAAKPLSEQKIDYNTSRANLEKQLRENNIQDRNLNLENILVFKPEIGDVHKYVADNMEFITKPDVITEPYTDPVSGEVISRTREVVTPETAKAQEKDLRNLYKTAKEPIKTAVKLQRDKDTDPVLSVMNDEDYFVAMYNPKFKEKMIDKVSGKSGGFEINFGGRKTNIEPGTLRPEPLPYGDKVYTGAYIFPTTTKSLTVPVGSGGSEQFMGQSWAPIKEGTVEATLYAYDPATDEFVFNVTSNQNAPWVQNNRPVSIPRSVIGDEADDLPIIKDGKKTTLKEAYGTMKKEKKKLPVTWSQGVYTGSKKTK